MNGEGTGTTGHGADTAMLAAMASNDGRRAGEQQEGSEEASGEEGSATVMSTVFGLSNNIVGAGILSLPSCFKESSIVEGVLLMVWVGCLSGLSLILIAVCCDLTRCFSFRGMGERTLGPTFGIILQSVMFVYTFFSCVSFMILSGDFMSGDEGIPRGLCADPCDDNWVVALLDTRMRAVFVLTIVVLCPLCSLRDLNALRYTSLLSIVGMFYLLGLLIHAYATAEKGDLPAASSLHIAEPRVGIFKAAPIVNVAFIAHYNVPRFYEELRDRSIAKFSTAVAIAVGVCGTVYIAVGVLGYLRFGNKVKGDILSNNFGPGEDRAAVFGRVAMACVVLFTYPLAFNSLRASALALLDRVRPGLRVAESRARFLALTYALVALTLTLGATVSSITVVLDYKGAILGGCIGFAFPAWIFLARADPSSVAWCCVKPLAGPRRPPAAAAAATGDRDARHSNADELADLHASLLDRAEEDKVSSLANRWRPAAFTFFVWAVVSGVMGVAITTLKLVNPDAE